MIPMPQFYFKRTISIAVRCGLHGKNHKKIRKYALRFSLLYQLSIWLYVVVNSQSLLNLLTFRACILTPSNHRDYDLFDDTIESGPADAAQLHRNLHGGTRQSQDLRQVQHEESTGAHELDLASSAEQNAAHTSQSPLGTVESTRRELFLEARRARMAAAAARRRQNQ